LNEHQSQNTDHLCKLRISMNNEQPHGAGA
jgi:hypothetical protein